MCTAVTYQTSGHYFGRNLDLEYAYRETVTITPRSFPLSFRCVPPLKRHHAMIGMAYVAEGYPLYYDAVNEAGLGMAGLNFPGYARYQPKAAGKCNIAPFELIPWVLGQCGTAAEARHLLKQVNLVNLDFSGDLPLTPLHWLIADRERSMTVEPLAEGLRIHENPIGVLTNSPPFDFHMTHLRNYMALSRHEPEDHLSDTLHLTPYSRGMGAMGLPGDLSSPSRFVKAAFTKLNAVSGPSEAESVTEFFHILGSVEQQRGCVELDGGAYEITRYSSCCNLDRGTYYYTTYENRQITAVELRRTDLDGCCLVSYPLRDTQQVYYENISPES